jgi:hypothetical protein
MDRNFEDTSKSLPCLTNIMEDVLNKLKKLKKGQQSFRRGDRKSQIGPEGRQRLATHVPICSK